MLIFMPAWTKTNVSECHHTKSCHTNFYYLFCSVESYKYYIKSYYSSREKLSAWIESPTEAQSTCLDRAEILAQNGLLFIRAIILEVLVRYNLIFIFWLISDRYPILISDWKSPSCFRPLPDHCLCNAVNLSDAPANRRVLVMVQSAVCTRAVIHS